MSTEALFPKRLEEAEEKMKEVYLLMLDISNNAGFRKVSEEEREKSEEYFFKASSLYQRIQELRKIYPTE